MSEHEGPHCDRCDYDLTGLTSDRCPECGKLIAFGWAIGGQSMTERRATPWDRRGGVGGFVRTWALAAFLPGRMARDFPARHSAASAVAYSLVCL